GLFTFDPHKLQGLSVDIVHGFRPPNQNDNAAGGLGNSAERLGAGFFIAIEGGDGSGKTTQIKRISRALADDGYHVESTREPGGTELGTKIRSVLFDSDRPSTRTEALLFAADRAHHVASLVDPNLDEGNIVITDRYIDSTIAYQAAGRNFDVKTILALSRWATQGLVPHLTIVLDIEPEAAAERMGKRGQSNYLDEENQQFHQRVRQTYLSRAHKEPDRYVVLDASVGADELTERILEAIRRRLAQTLAGRDSTPAEGALADTGWASETDDPAAGDDTAAGAAAGSAAAGAPAAGATAEGEDAAASGSSAARADPADDHGSADADSPADDDPATDEGSEPSDSAAAESPSAGEDSRHERGPRFVPVSGDRLIPESITDDEVEISGGVPTERVDLGANLREEPSASEGEDAGDLPSFLDSKDEPESDEEASTTVLPARGFTSGPLIDDTDDAEGVPTDRIETDSAEEAETRVVDHVD